MYVLYVCMYVCLIVHHAVYAHASIFTQELGNYVLPTDNIDQNNGNYVLPTNQNIVNASVIDMTLDIPRFPTCAVDGVIVHCG